MKLVYSSFTESRLQRIVRWLFPRTPQPVPKWVHSEKRPVHTWSCLLPSAGLQLQEALIYRSEVGDNCKHTVVHLSLNLSAKSGNSPCYLSTGMNFSPLSNRQDIVFRSDKYAYRPHEEPQRLQVLDLNETNLISLVEVAEYVAHRQGFGVDSSLLMLHVLSYSISEYNTRHSSSHEAFAEI